MLTTTYVSLCAFLLLLIDVSVSVLNRDLQAARAQLGGRNYPFASFLPRFWLQEIVEELDNSTAAAADRDTVQNDDDGAGSIDTLSALDDQFGARRPPMTRFRAQQLDRLGIVRDRPGSDADVPARGPSNNNPRANAGAGVGAPRQSFDQPKDSAQWLKLFRTRTRDDVYGPVETITCDMLDEVEYTSQRPYTHMGKTGLWHASFRSIQMIVKRPVAVRDPKKLVNDFDDEIKALQKHRDLSVVRLLGHCTSEASARPMIALERLSTWTSVSADASYSIADRLDLCLSACQMLSYWQARNVFCWDFQPSVIGVDSINRIVKLMDVTKLMPTPESDACATDRQCIPAIMKDTIAEDVARLSDFSCSTRTGSCSVPDVRTNVFSLCKIILLPMLRTRNPLLTQTSNRFRIALDALLNGCLQIDQQERWVVETIEEQLVLLKSLL